MSTLANYGFLPWLRQGLGSQIADKDTLGITDGSAIERATLKVDVTMKDTAIVGNITHDTVFTKNINITGPGDIAGINPRVVVRTEPPANLSNFESNNLAYIEFYEEDFLWRYTPAMPDSSIQSGQKLRPWLALVVLKDEEHKLTPNPSGLAIINVAEDKFDNAFHNPNDLWAFGHVHLNQHLDNMAALSQEVSDKLKANPDTGLSRLLCPRKLQRNTSYSAYLIPAFETGRLAGLGIDPVGILAQAPAWKKGAAMKLPQRKRSFDFPIYHYWQFKTGNFGDFESLASILKPIIISGQESGTLVMDIQKSGFGLDNVAESNTLGFEAALRPADFESEIFPKNTILKDVDYQQKLKNILNLSADLLDKTEATNVRNSPNPFYDGVNIGDDDPIIVPPVYGVWHILAQKVGVLPNPEWFNSLNLDPRYRAAAGLGTKVVQQHQEDFMNRAWEQVNEVNEANKKIRQAELVKMVANSIYKKHISTANEDKLISITNAVHGLMKFSLDKTFQQEFRESRIPVASKTPAFQKILRPTAKNKEIAPQITEQLITNFNAVSNPLTSAILKTSANGVLDAGKITVAINAAVASYGTDNLALAKDLFFIVAKAKQAGLLGTLIASKTLLNTAVDTTPITEVSVAVKTETKKIIAEILKIEKSVDNDKVLIITLKKLKYEEVFYDTVSKTGEDAKSYGSIEIRKEGFVLNPSDLNVIGSVTLFKDVKAFQSNFNQFWVEKSAIPQPALLPQFQGFSNIFGTIKTNIFPEITFSNRFLSLLFDLDKKPLGNLKPVMAYPVFKDAVYEFVLKLSKDYILPNVNKLEKNSIALLETNPKFIESFMLGMNHEMARELLWREYPTDQRGSYFRQFWSIKDSMIFPKPAEDLLDIKEIHKWTKELGTNGRGSILVLVIRGELLQKYPDTMIYAQKATYANPDASKARILPNDTTELNTKFPLFRAEIEPDITLVGFDLEDFEAKGHRIKKNGDSTVGKNPGWFFVLKQRPGHISFGLDDFTDEHGNVNNMPPAPAAWENMTWENMVNAKPELENYHLTFNKNFAPPNNPNNYQWNKNSADLAAILFQNPVLFARHAGEMLP